MLYFTNDQKDRPTGIQFSDSVVKSGVGTVSAKSVPVVFATEAARAIRKRRIEITGAGGWVV